MNVKDIILIPIFSIILLIIGILIIMVCIDKKEINNINNDNENNTEINLYDKTVKEIDLITLQINNSLGYSSSPYTLMENNKYYDELVSLGIKAIKPLYDKISSSPDAGLIEYIYAMAIEDIMFQIFTDNWSTAKEFQNTFLSFIIMAPIKYENIKNNTNLTDDEKMTKISELGLLVVPYIIDDIENSSNVDINYKLLLFSILSENNQINYLFDSFDIDYWINNNIEDYYLFKLIVS